MPRATVTVEPVRKDLKNAPPDGYVLLRPLPYGQSLQKRDMASRMTLEARRNAGGDNKMLIDTFQRVSNHYEFSHCIVDHNLEDDKGNKLNFHDDATFDMLDPRVGEEIEKYLGEMNNDQSDATVDSSGNVVDSEVEADFVSPSE